MPRRSKIEQLPAAIRKWFDEQLVAGGFAGYELLTAEANKQLKDSGYALTFGKSAAHRYGTKLELKLKAIKDSTDAAVAIAAAAPDDADLRSAATMSMVQSGLFDVLVNLQEAEATDDPAERLKLLSRAAKAVAELTRASIAQKKHELEVRAKVKAVAAAAERIARKGGLSKAGREELKREILGITG